VPATRCELCEIDLRSVRLSLTSAEKNPVTIPEYIRHASGECACKALRRAAMSGNNATQSNGTIVTAPVWRWQNRRNMGWSLAKGANVVNQHGKPNVCDKANILGIACDRSDEVHLLCEEATRIKGTTAAAIFLASADSGFLTAAAKRASKPGWFTRATNRREVALLALLPLTRRVAARAFSLRTCWLLSKNKNCLSRAKRGS